MRNWVRLLLIVPAFGVGWVGGYGHGLSAPSQPPTVCTIPGEEDAGLFDCESGRAYDYVPGGRWVLP